MIAMRHAWIQTILSAIAAGARQTAADITRTLGLDRCPPFFRDELLLAALLAGGLFVLGLWLFVPGQPLALRWVVSWDFLSLTLWQPLLEELLFRGFLQGQLSRASWGPQAWHGMTAANVITSLLFMLGHWWHHAPLWAIAVLAPSLLFGYVRDRYTSVYSSIALHGGYNAGYFWLTGVP